MSPWTFELAEINDLRPVDWATGKRVPLAGGEGNECQRCGRLHAVVWVVRETTPGQERQWRVGSGCGPRILDGWSPDKATISSARKRDTTRAKLAAWSQFLSEV